MLPEGSRQLDYSEGLPENIAKANLVFHEGILYVGFDPQTIAKVLRRKGIQIRSFQDLNFTNVDVTSVFLAYPGDPRSVRSMFVAKEPLKNRQRSCQAR